MSKSKKDRSQRSIDEKLRRLRAELTDAPAIATENHGNVTQSFLDEIAKRYRTWVKTGSATDRRGDHRAMMTHAKAKSEMRVECPAVVVVSDTTNFERNGLGRKLLERGVLIEKVVEPKTIGDVRATSLYCKSEPHVVIAVEGRYGSGVLKETEAIAASRGEFILLKYQTSDASWRKLDAVVAKRGREHAPAAANAQITQVVAADTREVSPQREPLNHLQLVAKDIETTDQLAKMFEQDASRLRHQLKEALANASALQTQLEVERQQGGVIARERLSRDLTMKEAQRLEVIALNDRLRESLEAEQTLRRRDQEEAAKLRAELEEERMDHERTKRRPPPVQVVSKTNETDEGLARMLKKVRAVVVAVEEDVLSDKDGIAKIAEAVR